MVRPIAKVFWLAAVLTATAAGQDWISIKTSHFEMYTSNGEQRARQALEVFEQVRYFFLQKSKASADGEKRVRVIAFSSGKEYEPYRLNAFNLAYYERSSNRDYIVMQDLEAGRDQAAVHEYTHLILQHLRLAIPLWLNEGLADVYSTLEIEGRRAIAGRPLPEHLAILARSRWIDWNTLFEAGQDSPFYNESGKASIFYAQSWALTHMLVLGPAYYANFPAFLKAMSRGTPAPQAFRSIYAKSVAEVGADLHAYLQQRELKVSVESLDAAAAVPFEATRLNDFQVSLALADLLASRPATAAQGQQRFLALQKEHPENPEIDESLGFLAWKSNDIQAARMHFAAAVRHGSRNAEMLLQYAELEQSENGPPAEIIELLKQVLALEPANDDARLFLVPVAANQNQCGLALSVASEIRSAVNPDRAFSLFLPLAFCRVQQNDFEGAETYARKALEYANTDGQRAQVQRILDYLRQARLGTSH